MAQDDPALLSQGVGVDVIQLSSDFENPSENQDKVLVEAGSVATSCFRPNFVDRVDASPGLRLNIEGPYVIQFHAVVCLASEDIHRVIEYDSGVARPRTRSGGIVWELNLSPYVGFEVVN